MVKRPDSKMVFVNLEVVIWRPNLSIMILRESSPRKPLEKHHNEQEWLENPLRKYSEVLREVRHVTSMVLFILIYIQYTHSNMV